MLYTTDQITHRLHRVHTLLDSPTFLRNSGEDSPWRPVFIEMMNLVDELLGQSEQLSHRIDFLDDVGVNGKLQDITSLVTWMYARLPELITDLSGQVPGNRLNRYFDQGTGYFENGCFFTSDYTNEVAFFLDDQRIYLNRHVRRAVNEAEAYLQADTLAN